MTAKAQASTAAQLAGRIRSKWTPPKPLEDGLLLEQGLLCVLVRRLSRTQAASTIKNLRGAFFDWNELRVAQVQEIVPHIPSRGKNGASLLVARDIKDYLQEVFQNNHGFDLEFLSEDLAAAGKFLTELTFLGAAASHYLLWLAGGRQFPVSLELVRVFDRLGLIGRTSSLKKARVSIGPLVPEGDELEFAVAFATVVENWCDRKKPICWECPLLEECPHGKKVHKEWKAQQQRLEAQRARDLARAAALEKKEQARLAREEARRKREATKLQRRLERDQQKRERENERRRQAELRKKKQEEKAKKREEAAKKKAAAAAAAKKAAAKKKAASKKKTSRKKATTRKTAKKPAARKKTKTKRSTQKTPTKKTGRKKTTTRSTGARKKVTKKKTTKKKATKKTPTRRTSKTRRKR